MPPIPVDIDQLMHLAAARVIIDIPTVTMPSAGEAGGFKWDVPTISFPSSPDWSNNHDS